jgi:hypothetical protein
VWAGDARFVFEVGEEGDCLEGFTQTLRQEVNEI